MKHSIALTEVGRLYAAAYMAHYTSKDLHEALLLYQSIIAAHPNAPEAEYARTQIQNIMQAVVPRHEILATQVKMALTHLERLALPDIEPTPETSMPTSEHVVMVP